MEETIYLEIIKNFNSEFDSRDYIVDYQNFSDYFTKTGMRDKRKKYFTINIGLKSLRMFDTPENVKIMGDAFIRCHTAMKATEDKYENITFNECSYDGSGIIQIKFCSVSDIALQQLTSRSKPFVVERW